MPQVAVRADKGRLSADDWAQAALDLIAEQGLQAVAVEPMARRLGVTKGSFYWHFPNREALIEAALAKWEENDLRTFERSVSIIKDPHDKMRSLFRRTREEVQSHVLFCALFMAVDHPRVKEVMERVSERRIQFLKQGFLELGMEDTEALHRARVTFMSYVGFLQYYQNFKSARMPLDELDEYVEHVIATLIPDSR